MSGASAEASAEPESALGHIDYCSTVGICSDSGALNTARLNQNSQAHLDPAPKRSSWLINIEETINNECMGINM